MPLLSLLVALMATATPAAGTTTDAAAAPTASTTCRVLHYSFEPDCLVRDAAGLCRFATGHPDFGPQIAVWVETGDGSRFVDTLMVTNAVALYGIGNRPGRWDLRSGPRFPYGRRPMALPVWAHRRGVLYSGVVMSDGRDDEIASHQQVSSPEPYFCRPMMASEVVDAITCASGNFRSVKGSFTSPSPDDGGITPAAVTPSAASAAAPAAASAAAPAAAPAVAPAVAPAPSYYPPRGDLVDWGNLCMPLISVDGAGCDYGDARQFGLLNDVDTVATATPRYDQTFTGSWTVPLTLAPGDYALLVEVGKEFDSNPSFTHGSFITPVEFTYYSDYGFDGNVGQPSVVYRLPFTIPPEPGAPLTPSSVTGSAGYGDWTGASGDLTPIDARITADVPGSGVARLRDIDGPAGLGRVHLEGATCAPVDCAASGSMAAPDPPRMSEPTATQDPAAATFQFRQGQDHGLPVLAYELRYAPDNQRQLDESGFERWAAAPAPPPGTPGDVATVTLPALQPETGYAVALRAQGTCGWSTPAFIRLYVGKANYTKLSGCVVATAAYGSSLHPDVALLRQERDRAVERSQLARLAALLYAESAPPLATLVGRSELARAVVRTLLRPAILANRGGLWMSR